MGISYLPSPSVQVQIVNFPVLASIEQTRISSGGSPEALVTVPSIEAPGGKSASIPVLCSPSARETTSASV